MCTQGPTSSPRILSLSHLHCSQLLLAGHFLLEALANMSAIQISAIATTFHDTEGKEPQSADTFDKIDNEIHESRLLNAQSEETTPSNSEGNKELMYEQSTPFIDHNSYFDCYDARTDTPLLARMKRAYSTLCLVRKSCEINGLNQQEMHAQLRNETMTLRPAKYSDIVPYAKILFVAVMDFAKSAFADFTEMSSQSRHSLVQSNFQLLQSLDGSYRALHNFPNDDTIMTSYTTYLNNEALEEFFSGCSLEFKSEEIFEQFRKNIKGSIELTKSQFRVVKPTIDEFLAIFGLALWNGYTANLSPETSTIVRRNRRAIMKELQAVYSRNCYEIGDSRMKEVFGLIPQSFQAIHS